MWTQGTGCSGSGAVTQLLRVLETLGLEGEIALSGRWVKLRGERCSVYVVESTDESVYYTWCGCPEDRVVESYHDPTEAIRVGLLRAAGRDME